MSDSIEQLPPSVPSSSGPIVGRTKYDFLVGFRWVIVAILLFFLVVYGIWSGLFSGVSIDLSGFSDSLREYWPLLIAFFFGIYLFHKIYWKWIVRGVVLIKESSPMVCYILTRERFQRLPGSLDAVSSSYTGRGIPVYRVKSVDLLKNEVEFGRQHIPGMSLGEVMTFSDRYEKMLEEYHVSEFDRNHLKDRVETLGMRLGRVYSNELLGVVAAIASGKDPYVVRSEKKEDGGPGDGSP